MFSSSSVLRATAILAVLLLSITLSLSPASAKTIYVNSSVPPSGSGTSWSDAYDSLQDALDTADPCDQIWVAAGTYIPTARIDPCDTRTATFQMINGVAIYGGFPSSGNPNFSDRNPNTYLSILSGDLLGNDDPCTPTEDLFNDPCRADNTYHVFYHPEELNLDNSALLDGFTITAGNSNLIWTHEIGGGMCNSHCSPTITNCTFKNNSSTVGGGGMYNGKGSNSVITNCTFANNSSGHPFTYRGIGGGGMYNIYNSPVVTNCSFIGNFSGQSGGGMYNNNDGNPTVTNCIFIANSANGGGGMVNDSNFSTVTNCTFTANSAKAGAGMVNDSGSPMITNCTFSNNVSTSGGGIYNGHASPTVSTCIFTANLARHDGGGIYNLKGLPTVINCIFNSNNARSGSGGGINNYPSSPTVTNCNFTANSAGAGGGGICNRDHSNPILTNCTFTANSTNKNQYCYSCYGGGIYNYWYCNPILTHCTFIGNSAKYGGGIANRTYSSPILINCTFSGNIAVYGNTLVCGDSYKSQSPGTIVLTNSILHDGENSIWDRDKSAITINYSNVPGGPSACYDPCDMITWGLGNIDADPCFVDPGSWQDPCNTPSDPNDDVWIAGDYRLRSCSPCIDAADGDSAPPTDILGNDRYDHPNIQNSGTGNPDHVDMGAYEFQGPNLSYIKIIGKQTMVEYFGTQYKCTAYYDDGDNVDVSCDALWSANSNDVSIDDCGYLTTFGIIENRVCLITASYQGKSDQLLTIINNNITLSFDYEGEGVISGQSGIYDLGEVVPLRATPAPGWRIASWHNTDNDLSISKTNTVTMNGSTNVTVVFEPVPSTPISIRQCLVIPGLDPAQSTFILSGSVPDCPADLGWSRAVKINFGPYEQTISDFIQFGSTYLYRGTGSGISLMLLNMNQGSFMILTRNVDLIGLSNPIPIDVKFVDYAGTDSYTARNLSLSFMNGFADCLRIDSARLTGNLLLVRGGIALANPGIDLNHHELTISTSQQQFTIPPGLFRKIGSMYLYSDPLGANGNITQAIFDCNRCTFTLMIRNTNLNQNSGTVPFRLQFDSFDQTTDLNL